MGQLVVEFQAVVEDAVQVVYLFLLGVVEGQGAEVFCLRGGCLEAHVVDVSVGGCDAQYVLEEGFGRGSGGAAEFVAGELHGLYAVEGVCAYAAGWR